MTTNLVKRSVTIAGHRVDIRIEDLFWISLEEIARAEATTTSRLVASIDAERDGADLNSAIRVYVIDHFMSLAESLDDMDDDVRDNDPFVAGMRAELNARPRWLN
jgi:predicted DNA-binding ribbon-helix-helix protein